MTPKRFVLTFLFDPTFTKVVLIRKTKPDWMAGKLNAPGGHVEDEETFEQAAVREFQEEAGVDTQDRWHPFLRLFRPGDDEETLRTLECFWGVSKHVSEAKTITDEEIGLFDVQSLQSRNDIVKDTLWILIMAQEAATRYVNELGELYFEAHDMTTESQWKQLE